MSGLDKLLTKQHKIGSTAYNKWHGMIGLQLVCWQKVDTLNTFCDDHCDNHSTDLECLKMFIKFHFTQQSDVINFAD